ncbi:hypothetical protein WH47_03505 [Habropoda laboriosa]|uniref:Uncharacterized protein n=1 Tax=Habropoda laboriosa TaxID=597456 RepID=A0A0L7RBQ2_9HYME|nr:hypothetical protein WH47_03505 [Habropoda laboriosa]
MHVFVETFTNGLNSNLPGHKPRVAEKSAYGPRGPGHMSQVPDLKENPWRCQMRYSGQYAPTIIRRCPGKSAPRAQRTSGGLKTKFEKEEGEKEAREMTWRVRNHEFLYISERTKRRQSRNEQFPRKSSGNGSSIRLAERTKLKRFYSHRIKETYSLHIERGIYLEDFSNENTTCRHGEVKVKRRGAPKGVRGLANPREIPSGSTDWGEDLRLEVVLVSTHEHPTDDVDGTSGIPPSPDRPGRASRGLCQCGTRTCSLCAGGWPGLV